MADDYYTPKIVSRKEAKSRGLTLYFTGIPCKNGHISERRVKCCTCLACAVIRNFIPNIIPRDRISRKRAHAHGLDRYFTGLPCKHGHIAERYVSCARCVTCAHETRDKKEQILIRYHNRLSRIKGNGGKLSIKDIRYLKDTQKKCYWCHKRFTKTNPATLEHITAISKGGKNDITNVILAHRACNSKKGNRMILLL